MEVNDPYEDSVTGCFVGGCNSLWRTYVDMISDNIVEGNGKNDKNEAADDENIMTNNDNTYNVNFNVYINGDNANAAQYDILHGGGELTDTQNGVLGCHRTGVCTYFIRNKNYIDKISIEPDERKREDTIERKLYSSIRNYANPSRQRY